MAERIVGIPESQWPPVRDGLRQLIRGGLEHPFYRRRGPVFGDDSPRLFKNGTSDKIGGPRGSGGIDNVVLCYRTNPDGTHSSDPADRVEVDFSRLNGLCFCCDSPTTDTSTEPAYNVTAIPGDDGQWIATSGGIDYFEGEFDASALTVTPELGGASVPAVTVTVPCDRDIADEEQVGVKLYNTVCRVTWECCS